MIYLLLGESVRWISKSIFFYSRLFLVMLFNVELGIFVVKWSLNYDI